MHTRSIFIITTGLLFATSTAASAHDPAHDPDGSHHHHHAPATAPAESLTVSHAVTMGSGDHTYTSLANWCKLPWEGPMGNTHGGIVVDHDGLVYFNTDTERSIMVFKPDGTFVRSFGKAHVGIHNMSIVEEGGEQFIYAAHLAGDRIVKFSLEGEALWTLPVPAESGKYEDNAGAYNPTAVAVGPDGDIYIADGYGRNWIHQFDSDRNYIRSFGGHGQEPGQFRTCHGLAIDSRGEEPVLLVCDRENRRLQRFTLEGEFIDVAATDLRRPCAVSIWGELLAVAELEGRVVLLDKDFNMVAKLGDNPDRSQWANHGVPPEAWQNGIFTAPHAVCFDADGNLYVQDWNASGRISKLKRQASKTGQ